MKTAESFPTNAPAPQAAIRSAEKIRQTKLTVVKDSRLDRRVHRRSGLSLIELTIVILVIGVISAVGVPRVSRSYQSNRARDAAHQLASDLLTFRERCRIESRELTIVWNQGQRRYHCDEVGFQRRVGHGFRVSTDFAPNDTIQFGCEGQLQQPADSGTFLIGQDPTWQVDFGGSTGRVSVHQVVDGATSNE